MEILNGLWLAPGHVVIVPQDKPGSGRDLGPRPRVTPLIYNDVGRGDVCTPGCHRPHRPGTMGTMLDMPFTEPDREAADHVTAQLVGRAPLGVAFSGGVDSSTLLALAARALGRDQVLAILGVSPSLAAEERSAAHRVAAFVGVRLVEVQTREGESAAYRRNGPDRCFHCKDELFTRISDEIVDRYVLAAVAYGENADDARRPDRPGARAAVAHTVLRPLADGPP